MRPAQKLLFTIVMNVALTIVLLLTAEGLASVILVAKQTFFNATLAERKHTEYDEEIGWINLPNLNVPDLYGRGRSLRTNGLRYRSNSELSAAIPADKVRVVCS